MSLRQAPAGPDDRLLFLLALSLPFPLLGVPLNEFFTLSLTSLIGFVYVIRRVAHTGLTALHRVAILMLLTFGATAVYRHPVTSYVLSLGALGLAVMPFATPAGDAAGARALVRGLRVGLWLTIACVVLSLLVQVAGLRDLPFGLLDLLVRPEMGVFLGYVRPAAGFSEPSHLAIYLTTVYVVLDQLPRAGRGLALLRPLIVAVMLLSGSLSGVVLVSVYLAGKGATGLVRAMRRGVSSRLLLQTGAAVTSIVAAVLVFGPDPLDLMDEYVERIVKTQEDIESLNLVGSEASRINSVLSVADYWEAAGLPGFLLGTGYANYEEWLLATYGHLGESATFARGQNDSILVAVFLSTGLLGFLAYLWLLAKGFGSRVLGSGVTIGLFVLAVNFSYGFLISGLYWNLLFVLASVARWSLAQPATRRRSGSTRPVPGRRRPPAPALPTPPLAQP